MYLISLTKTFFFKFVDKDFLNKKKKAKSDSNEIKLNYSTEIRKTHYKLIFLIKRKERVIMLCTMGRKKIELGKVKIIKTDNSSLSPSNYFLYFKESGYSYIVMILCRSLPRFGHYNFLCSPSADYKKSNENRTN